MQPYEISILDELYKYLVVAEDTSEAKELLAEYLKKDGVATSKTGVGFAREEDMKLRTCVIGQGWGSRRLSHWERYRMCKKNQQKRVVGRYII